MVNGHNDGNSLDPTLLHVFAPGLSFVIIVLMDSPLKGRGVRVIIVNKSAVREYDLTALLLQGWICAAKELETVKNHWIKEALPLSL